MEERHVCEAEEMVGCRAAGEMSMTQSMGRAVGMWGEVQRRKRQI